MVTGGEVDGEEVSEEEARHVVQDEAVQRQVEGRYPRLFILENMKREVGERGGRGRGRKERGVAERGERNRGIGRRERGERKGGNRERENLRQTEIERERETPIVSDRPTESKYQGF